MEELVAILLTRKLLLFSLRELEEMVIAPKVVEAALEEEAAAPS